MEWWNIYGIVAKYFLGRFFWLYKFQKEWDEVIRENIFHGVFEINFYQNVSVARMTKYTGLVRHDVLIHTAFFSRRQMINKLLTNIRKS